MHLQERTVPLSVAAHSVSDSARADRWNPVPPRMLERGDRAEFIQDFTAAENRALLVTALLDDANRASRGQVLRVWRRLCCTEKGRRAATKMAIGFLEHPVRDVPAILGALWELTISHPCRAEGPASGGVDE